jgi:hypothetical protein
LLIIGEPSSKDINVVYRGVVVVVVAAAVFAEKYFVREIEQNQTTRTTSNV